MISAQVAARGARRLDYNRFLEALAQTSLRLYPTLDPCEAFAALCAEHIFGLVAVESDARGTVQRVLDDLERPAPAPVPGEMHEPSEPGLNGLCGRRPETPNSGKFSDCHHYALFTDCDASANTNFGAKWKFKFSFELENAWEGAKRTRAARQSKTRAAPWRPPPT